MTDKCDHEDGCVVNMVPTISRLVPEREKEIMVEAIFKFCPECGHKIEETK